MDHYVAGPVERFGRRIKIEYLGMASVYSITALLFFHDALLWYQTLLATLGAFFLFLGFKKKTEDHLVGSLVLFAAVGLAQGPIRSSGWVVPYMLFGATIFTMEGYLERRPMRIYALPVLFLVWSLADSSWWLGWVFVALYLGFPRKEKPQFRRLLALLVGISALLGFSAHAIRFRSVISSFWPFPPGHVPLGSTEVTLLIVIGLPTLSYGSWVSPMHLISSTTWMAFLEV